MTNDTLRINTKLKIDLSDYSIDVSITDFRLTLFRIWDNETNVVKTYSIGLGRPAYIPKGNFTIKFKLKDPVWYKPNSKPIPFGTKENILGTRWLSIDAPGYGIHGTWEPETIGTSTIIGCIRMHNEDIEELYDIIKNGTPITIHD